ncbi:MAG: SHOCT domain-containing protein [Candidatus Cloacimonadales bacterium]|nr:SHOCT domain-containing protein [Candidatus Cloacimonadales bacterium]
MFYSLMQAGVRSAAPQGTEQAPPFLLILFVAIIYFIIVKPKVDRMQNEKKALRIILILRIIGIVLALIGGIFMISFILAFIQANGRFYIFVISFQTWVNILTIVVGIFLMSAKKNTNHSENESITKSQKSELDELEKLAELRDKGIITEEEFNTKKKKILGS